MQLRDFFSLLFPVQVNVTHREKFLSVAGGAIAIAATAWISSHFIEPGLAPFLAASMGASTILLLAVPHSPFSQPWPLVGGHLVAALAGITCAKLIPDIYLASALAIGLTVVAMFYLRCIHPPGGGTALLVLLGGPKLQALGYHFMLQPLLTNLIILLAATLIINKLIPGRRYPLSPHRTGKASAPPAGEKPPVKLSFDEADLRSALREIDGVIDVTDEDLIRIYALATLHAHQRGLDSMTLRNIMTQEVVTVSAGAPLEAVWELLRRHRIRGVPVVDAERRVIGMVAIADFLKQTNWRMCITLIQRLKLLFKRSPTISAGEIMTAPAITVAEATPLTETFSIFAQRGINHLPVVDSDQRLIGIVTRLDLLAALYGDRIEAWQTAKQP